MESSNLNDIIEINDIPLGEGLYRKRKVATSSPRSSEPSSYQHTETSITHATPTKKFKAKELPDWSNDIIESTNKFLSTLRNTNTPNTTPTGNTPNTTPSGNTQTNNTPSGNTQNTTPQTVLLPLPPVGGLTSRFINNEKDGKIPCIQRESFKPLKEFIERKEGLTCVYGPHGVGKSFTLYHLYCTLSISDKSRVMYIPDCALLNSGAYQKLYDAIIAAFALDSNFLQQVAHYAIKMDGADWRNFLFKIINYCKTQGLTFYAIFDQYNGLEDKFRTQQPTYLTKWPADLPGAKIIISASANNEDIDLAITKEDDESLYWFSGGYSPAELSAWQGYYHFFDGQDLSMVTHATSNVPFELDKLRRLYTKNSALDLTRLVEDFRQSRIQELISSHRKYLDQFLRKQKDLDTERKCMFYVVNQLTWEVGEEYRFDRQLFFFHRDESTGFYYIEPTTPLVRYITILRLEKQDIESLVSSVVGTSFFTNDAKERTVENYIIHEITKRLSLNVRLHNVCTDSKGRVLNVADLEVIRFTGNGVPAIKPIRNAIFVPILTNYPDIDFFIWIHDTRTLYAFQVAVGKNPTEYQDAEHSNNWGAGQRLFDSWQAFLTCKHFHKVWITAKPLDKSISKTSFGKSCSAHKFMDIHDPDVTHFFTALKHFRWSE